MLERGRPSQPCRRRKTPTLKVSPGLPFSAMALQLVEATSWASLSTSLKIRSPSSPPRAVPSAITMTHKLALQTKWRNQSGRIWPRRMLLWLWGTRLTWSLMKSTLTKIWRETMSWVGTRSCSSCRLQRRPQKWRNRWMTTCQPVLCYLIRREGY